MAFCKLSLTQEFSKHIRFIANTSDIEALGVMASTQPNPFLLAADNPTRLLTLLRENPSIASEQDEHGYSLLHAAASYNHLDLLRSLVNEFHVNVNIKDEDGETALFVAETSECARILVEQLQIDTTVRGEDGKTAREKIVADEEFPEVAVYLMVHEFGGSEDTLPTTNGGLSAADIIGPVPRLPNGVSIDVGTMTHEDAGEDHVDPEFRRRIEELASREDFQGEDGQKQLRELITDVLRGQAIDHKDARQRTT
jgi:hypothetical protein